MFIFIFVHSVFLNVPAKSPILPENKAPLFYLYIMCNSSAKGCGFDSQGTHIVIKNVYLNAIVVALDKSVC